MKYEENEYFNLLENFVEKYYHDELSFNLNDFFTLVDGLSTIIDDYDEDVIININRYLNQIMISVINEDYYRIIDIIDGVLIDVLRKNVRSI